MANGTVARLEDERHLEPLTVRRMISRSANAVDQVVTMREIVLLLGGWGGATLHEQQV